MKKAITDKIKNAEAKITPVVLGTSAAFMSMYPMITTYAAGDASGIMKEIFEIIATIIIALGIVLCVLGVVHYASAYSEGDGPAKQKAIMQIAAGSMILLMSVILKDKAGDLASNIST